MSAAAPTTRKLLAALNAKGQASNRGAFVIPSPDGTPSFVEVRSGKIHQTAYMVYVGKDTTVSELADRAARVISEPNRTTALLGSYLEELQRFKIGNVLEIESNNGTTVRLRLVSNTPKFTAGPKLPG
jgi:hypothetical protein